MSTVALPEQMLLAECRALQALARQLTRDTHAADDAVQDTLVAGLTKAAPVGNVGHWLAAVLRNALRKEQRADRRRKGREAGAAGPEQAPSAAEVCEQIDLHRRLLAMVQTLEAPVQQAMFLRFWRGMSAREIGRALELPVKTVQGRLERGLQQLRRRLDHDHGRRAWVAMLAPLGSGGVLGLCAGGLLLMKTKVLVGGSLLAALFVLLPWIWPGEERAPSVVPEAGAARATVADRGTAATTASQREVVEVAPAPVPEAHAKAVMPEVSGRVVDLHGAGIAAAEVRFERRAVDGMYVADPALAPVRSDASGAFRIAFPGREGWLTGTGANWATVRRAWLGSEVPAEELVVVVAPARSYRGTVIDPDGAPVADARVVVLVEGRLVPTRAVAGQVVTLPNDLAAVSTDAEGRFAFERIGWIDGAQLIASHDPLQPARVALPEGSSEDVLLRLLAANAEPRVHGVVIDAAGRPAAGAFVSVGADSAVTGADGWFAVPWAWRKQPELVRAVKTDVGAVSARLVPGADQPGWSALRPITLQLPAAPGEVRGHVVDREGRPVPGAAVWTPDLTWLGNVTASEQGHELSRCCSVEGTMTAANFALGMPGVLAIVTRTGDDGAFALRGLLSRSYALFALAPGSLQGAGPVTASPGDVVELRLEAAASQTVAGRIVSRQGTPLANVNIGLGRSFAWQRPVRAEDPWAGSSMMPAGAVHSFSEGGAVTDAAGRFRLEGVQTERTFLTFSGDAVFASAPFHLDGAGRPDQLEVVVDARSTFRFELERPGEADAFKFAPEGERHVSLFVRVESFVMSMGQVDFVDGRAPEAFTRAGPVTVVLLHKGKEVRRAVVELRPGGVHTLRL